MTSVAGPCWTSLSWKRLVFHLIACHGAGQACKTSEMGTGQVPSPYSKCSYPKLKPSKSVQRFVRLSVQTQLACMVLSYPLSIEHILCTCNYLSACNLGPCTVACVYALIRRGSKIRHFGRAVFVQPQKEGCICCKSSCSSQFAMDGCEQAARCSAT